MEHGRIIRVRFPDGKTALYVVAEQDAGKAEMILLAQMESDVEVEHVGHASLRLLLAMSMSPGEIKRTDV
jgi:hypothetical protein